MKLLLCFFIEILLYFCNPEVWFLIVPHCLLFLSDDNILFLYHISLFFSHSLSPIRTASSAAVTLASSSSFKVSLYGILSPINSIFPNVPTLLCLCYGSFSNSFLFIGTLSPLSLSVTRFWAALTPAGSVYWARLSRPEWDIQTCVSRFTDCMNSKFNLQQTFPLHSQLKADTHWGDLRSATGLCVIISVGLETTEKAEIVSLSWFPEKNMHRPC